MNLPVLAHAHCVRHITRTDARSKLELKGFCEYCGNETQKVAFFPATQRHVEACASCLSDANVIH